MFQRAVGIRIPRPQRFRQTAKTVTGRFLRRSGWVASCWHSCKVGPFRPESDLPERPYNTQFARGTVVFIDPTGALDDNGLPDSAPGLMEETSNQACFYFRPRGVHAAACTRAPSLRRAALPPLPKGAGSRTLLPLSHRAKWCLARWFLFWPAQVGRNTERASMPDRS